MRYCQTLTDSDRRLAERLAGFVPDEIYDIHAHPVHLDYFSPDSFGWLRQMEWKSRGCAEHQKEIARYIPARRIHGLYFGMPHAKADRSAINDYVAKEVETQGTPLSRALALVSPQDKREAVAALLASGRFCGLKVYHVYSDRPDTMNASIEEYAPDWMWELLHEMNGILMLHIVRTGAMEDAHNQASLRHLCLKYPRCRVVLAITFRPSGFETILDRRIDPARGRPRLCRSRPVRWGDACEDNANHESAQPRPGNSGEAALPTGNGEWARLDQRAGDADGL